MGLGQWLKDVWNAGAVMQKFKDGESLTPDEVETVKRAYSGRTPAEQLEYENAEKEAAIVRKKERNDELEKRRAEESRRNRDDPKWKFSATRNASPLRLDGTRNTWRIGDYGTIYLCSDLLSYQLKEDDSLIAQGGISIGGIVGGNVAGGFGGMTSSFTGKQRIAHTISRMEIFINVAGSVRNTRTIKIYKGAPLDVTTRAYRSYFKNAQEIISVLDDIARRGSDNQ